MRLIDADELLDAISVHLERIEQEFDDAPTIEAVPVRHGYWKATDDPMFRACSVCGYLEWVGLWNNYCPECGTKMDGGTDNETD